METQRGRDVLITFEKTRERGKERILQIELKNRQESVQTMNN